MNSAEIADALLLRRIMDVFPAPVLILDSDLVIHYRNRAMDLLLGCDSDTVLPHDPLGKILYCLVGLAAPGGCGTSEQCSSCVIRACVGNAFKGESAYRQRCNIMFRENEKETKKLFLATAQSFDFKGVRRVLLILEDMTELFELERLLPVCANCKKIRNDEGYWQNIEHFLKERHDYVCSHTVCPDCLLSIYGLTPEEISRNDNDAHTG